jgi:hypothetical protein
VERGKLGRVTRHYQELADVARDDEVPEAGEEPDVHLADWQTGDGYGAAGHKRSLRGRLI